MGERSIIGWVAVVTCVVGSGCASHRGTRARAPADRPATPADAPPRDASTGASTDGGLRPGWTRYEQRKTIPLGGSVTAGPEPYARVRLLEVSDDRRSAVFEAAYLVDQRRGRVMVGETFATFTSIFGKKGATLESVGPSGATVVFRWTQNRAMPVPPGAVALSQQPGPSKD
jgi:hypothetical protein